mgnify:CR=1 FL=1
MMESPALLTSPSIDGHFSTIVEISTSIQTSSFSNSFISHSSNETCDFNSAIFSFKEVMVKKKNTYSQNNCN